MTGTLADFGYDTFAGSVRSAHDYPVARPPEESRPKPLPEPSLAGKARLADYLPAQKAVLTSGLISVVRALFRGMAYGRIEAATRVEPLQPTKPQIAPIRPQARPARQMVSAKAFAMHMEHLHYLMEVSSGDDAPITRKTALEAQMAWQMIWAASGRAIPVPAACTGPDGKMFYSWDSGRHHLELEIVPGRDAEFFYQDRESGDMWGEDYRIGDPLPGEAISKLGFFS